MPRIVPSDVLQVLRSVFPEGEPVPPLVPGWDAHVAMIVGLLDEIPPELITPPPDLYVGFIAARAAMRDTLAAWKARDNRDVRVPGFSVHPIDLIREALRACPGEAVLPGTPELTFLPEPPREGFRLELSAVRNALANDEAKATTVLAGSLLEALLLWALQQRPPADIDAARTALAVSMKGQFVDPGSDLTARSWTLSHYIEVAAHLGIIGATTAEQARLAKDYRNLIHPAAAIRLKEECHRGTALGAAAAVEFVIRDLPRTGSP